MRRAVLVAALGLMLLAASPALAAPQTVSVGNNFFSPGEVTVAPAEAVTWRFSAAGNHSITSDPGQPASFESDPGNPFPNHPAGFTFAHTFAAAGTTSYFCRVHPTTMRARVVVVAGGGPVANVAPALSGVRADPATFCNDRSEECDKRGTKVRFSLSEDATVRIKVREKGEDKVLKSFRASGKAGKNKVTFSGRGLEPGTYEAKLTPVDAAGATGKTKTARLTVEK